MADEAGVLKHVTLLHDRESGGDHGSEERKPQNHFPCIGTHESQQ